MKAGVADGSNPSYHQDSTPGVIGITEKGECILDTDVSSTDSPVLFQERKHFINFGEDTVIGCYLRMTSQEVVDFCSAYSDSKLRMLARNPPTRESLTATGGVATVWKFGFTHVGEWGNSTGMGSFLEIEDMGDEAADKSPAATSVNSGSCEVLASTEFQFLYAYFGEYGNPQAKVVAATASNRRMTVQHTL